MRARGGVLGQRALQVADGLDLDGPEKILDEGLLGEPLQPGSELLLEAGEAQKLVRAVEGEDLPASRRRVEPVGELLYRACRFIGEHGPAAVGGSAPGKALQVLLGLKLDALQTVAFGLCLDDAGHLAVHVEEVVGVPGL